VSWVDRAADFLSAASPIVGMLNPLAGSMAAAASAALHAL